MRSAAAAYAERSYVRYLDGGCTSPVAAYADIKEDELTLRGLYYDDASGRINTGYVTGKYRPSLTDEDIKYYEKLGIALADKLRKEAKGL